MLNGTGSGRTFSTSGNPGCRILVAGNPGFEISEVGNSGGTILGIGKPGSTIPEIGKPGLGFAGTGWATVDDDKAVLTTVVNLLATTDDAILTGV